MSTHKHYYRPVLAILLVLMLLIPASTAGAQNADKQVWALYMGFWGGEGSWAAQSSVLKDYPAIGRYDSRDGGVVATQIGQAQAAGIDAFIVSWNGLNDGVMTTPTLNNVLDRAAERGFHAAAAVDVFSPNFNTNRQQMVDSLNYLINDRAHHPGYLRYNGKPVIFFLFQERTGFSNAEWLSIRNQLDPGHNTIWIAEGLSGCCLHAGAMDGMYAFNLAWANGSASRFSRESNATGSAMYIPTVHPGWDESLIAARDGRPNPTSIKARGGGSFLRTSFNNATTVNPNVMLIVSWNEFAEGSHIEPSIVYGNQSVSTLTALISAWKASGGTTTTTPPTGGATSSPTGKVLEAATTLNVRAAAGTSGAKLGTIRPGTKYAVLGLQGDWYSIDFNGQTGWVWMRLVYVSQGTVASTPTTGTTPTTTGGSAAASPTGKLLEATGGLNVRATPSGSAAKLGTIRPGTKYAVLDQQGIWYAIDFNGQKGWVWGVYANVTGGTVATVPTTPAPVVKRVLKVHNLTSSEFCALHVIPSYEDGDWGANKLTDKLPNGGAFITFQLDPTWYNARAVGCDGRYWEIAGADISNGDYEWWVTDAGAMGP